MRVGIDLAWSTGATGLAAVDDDGRLLTSTSVQDDDQIAGWLEQLPGPPRVVAVDAPLVVPNDTGQRLPERLIAQTFGPYGASAHSANRTLLGDQPRAMRLARRFGWTVDPHARPSDDQTVCIEVYPHPALIGLFRLPYRLAYKKGTIAARLPGSCTSPTCWSPSPSSTCPPIPAGTRSARPSLARPGELTRYEDEIDAIVCAHLGLALAAPTRSPARLRQPRRRLHRGPTTTHAPGRETNPPAPEPQTPGRAGAAQQERKRATPRKVTGPGSAAQRLADDAADIGRCSSTTSCRAPSRSPTPRSPPTSAASPTVSVHSSTRLPTMRCQRGAEPGRARRQQGHRRADQVRRPARLLAGGAAAMSNHQWTR